jgi:NADPH-dependent 2,4-dienoyl-CoA reductase/sulfur reductase-like enzyme
VVVVGGGFIGCEVAAAAARLGLRTHLIAPESAPLLAAVGELVGTEVRSRLTDLGVIFHLDTVPLRYHGGDHVEGVLLSDDQVVSADVVIEAVGSDPNVEWLADNDLDLSNGVLADAKMRVSGREDVVACGDVARFPIVDYDDEPRRLEHWTVAVDTARVAGANLAHHLLDQEEQVTEFAAVPSFWSHLADLKIQSFGQPALGLDDVRVLEGDLRTEAAIGYHRDRVLVGVVLLGLTSRFASYRNALDRSALALAGG